MSGSLQAAESERPAAVADMRYGAALFAFYQEEYFSALTELMVADERGGITTHGDYPRLLQGGISLSYGLEDAAEPIFDELLDNHADAPVRDRARFYQGKLNYLRGENQQASQLFAKIGDALSADYLAELDYYNVNIAIREGQLEQASQQLTSVNAESLWAPYLYFNLGAAYAEKGEWQTSVGLLSQLDRLKNPNDEYRILRDKANTAAGYTYLLSGDFNNATYNFLRVRLDSPLVDKALLGYGWAAAQQGDFELALRSWQQLSKKPLTSESVQEVLIAIPFAYEKLSADGEALEKLNDAVSVYEDELIRVAQALADIEKKSVLNFFSSSTSLDENTWLEQGASVDINLDMPYLAPLVSGQAFQNGLQQLQDLEALRHTVMAWQRSVEAFHFVIETKEASRAAKLKQINSDEHQQKIAQLRQQRDELYAAIQRGQHSEKALELMTVEQRKLHDRIEKAQHRIERLATAGKPVAKKQAKLERYRAVLDWQLAETYPERSWQGRKAVAQLDAALTELAASNQSLQQVIATAPDLQSYNEKISVMEARLQTVMTDIQRVHGNVQGEMKALTKKRLEQHQQRISYYLSQARLAIARLYDKRHLEASL